MNWFNVIKVDEDERIRGVLIHWIEEYVDFINEMILAIDAKQKELQESNINVEEQINSLPEQQRDLMRDFVANLPPQVIPWEKLRKQLEDNLTVLEELQENINEIPVLVSLKGAKDNFADALYSKDNPLIEGLEEPRAPNFDRMIRRLEMGEGYEE